LLRNDGGKFSDVTEILANGLADIGMVTSAIWSDYNNDSWMDLLVVGEWLPVHIFENRNGILIQITDQTDLKHTHGWWNSITASDFDRDGDPDYVVGNLGKNTNYRASFERPFCIYAKDFDENGIIDPVMSQYYGDINYPVALRDALIRQINPIIKKFPSYLEYARSSFKDIFSEEDWEDALVLKSHVFESVYLENDGEGHFTIKTLPIEGQIAPLFGMVPVDYNQDGFMDVVMVGNSYSTEVGIGRYDAFTGLVLKGDGTGSFTPLSHSETGFWVDGDAKSMVRVVTHNNQQVIWVGQNMGKLLAFGLAGPVPSERLFRPDHLDAWIILKFSEGTRQKIELTYGSSYLSQSSRVQIIPHGVDVIEVYGFDGKLRKLVNH